MTRKKSNRTTAEIKAMMAEEGDFLRPIVWRLRTAETGWGNPLTGLGTCSAIDLRLASWVCLKAIE
jgi:hypothetical protein